MWLVLLLACSISGALSSCIDSYDYIIVGGGPGGLTVANRLSELPNVTVAVIEAGGDVSQNPNVTDPNRFTLPLNTPIDWQYTSTNQTYATGQTMGLHAGKALGGTTTVNGMTYIRAEKSQIDSWGTIGNPGWSWDDLFTYYKKSEDLTQPTVAQIESGATFDPNDHGEDGYLKVGWPNGLVGGPLHTIVKETWNALGLPLNLDVNSGSVRGFSVWPSTLDAEANVREDAARAYYQPIQARPNLHVYLNTTATNIIWADDAVNAVATGVELISSDGSTKILTCKKEVILSAGALRSPAILELSGIGNPEILNKYGIEVKVDLPGVGESLQDQPNNVIIYMTNSTINGSVTYATFGAMDDFFQDWEAKVDIPSFAQTISTAIDSAISPTSLEKLLTLQYDLLKSGVTNAESIVESTVMFGLGPTNLLVTPFWLLMPFSRGNVHITSPDPKVFPAINPNFFLVSFDLDVQVAIAKWTRKFWATEPMKSLVVSEVTPGFDVLPANATDAEWAQWIKTSTASNSHPLGTAAMLPRELGGVVDERLRVYGTGNVRVVDASVMPFQVSGHLSGTIYAIAEKAAVMIKEDVVG